jgi:histidine triad (HIT) family protein
MASIFSRIIAGEIPSYKVAENDHCIAFLDINPLKEGHTLVVPKEEVDYIFDLEEESLLNLHSFARQVALAIEKVVPCSRIGMAVIGLEVPHTHIHLIPIDGIHDIDFSKPKKEFSQEQFVHLAARISTEFEKGGTEN